MRVCAPSVGAAHGKLTRRQALSLLLAAPLANGSDYVTAIPPQPAPRPRPKTIVIGDSLAFMMRPHLEPEGIKVLGRGGSNLGQWLKNGWLRDALRLMPDLVCVSLGANDYPVRVNREAFRARAGKLVERCTIVGVDVLWLAPPSAEDFVADQAARAGAPVLRPPKMPMSDRVHPTRRGFTIWTSHILRRVR